MILRFVNSVNVRVGKKTKQCDCNGGEINSENKAKSPWDSSWKHVFLNVYSSITINYL